MDECASHVTLFTIQELSLELAALATNKVKSGEINLKNTAQAT